MKDGLCIARDLAARPTLSAAALVLAQKYAESAFESSMLAIRPSADSLRIRAAAGGAVATSLPTSGDVIAEMPEIRPRSIPPPLPPENGGASKRSREAGSGSKSIHRLEDVM